jgi:hypothetical protein
MSSSTSNPLIKQTQDDFTISTEAPGENNGGSQWGLEGLFQLPGLQKVAASTVESEFGRSSMVEAAKLPRFGKAEHMVQYVSLSEIEMKCQEAEQELGMLADEKLLKTIVEEEVPGASLPFFVASLLREYTDLSLHTESQPPFPVRFFFPAFLSSFAETLFLHAASPPNRHSLSYPRVPPSDPAQGPHLPLSRPQSHPSSSPSKALFGRRSSRSCSRRPVPPEPPRLAHNPASRDA